LNGIDGHWQHLLLLHLESDNQLLKLPLPCTVATKGSLEVVRICENDFLPLGMKPHTPSLSQV
jgi:hypothetical protein